jgi:hypothetical protein
MAAEARHFIADTSDAMFGFEKPRWPTSPSRNPLPRPKARICLAKFSAESNAVNG